MSNKPWVGKSVVIIDDSRLVREELRAVFEGCGMQVVGEAENGVVGLAMIQKHKPEVVSLDMIMPEMDGVECYRNIQAKYAETRVVIVTWLAREQKIIDNLKDLMPPHLFQTKPVSVAEMHSRLEKIYFPHLIKAAKTVEETAADDLEDLGDLGIKVS